MKKILLILLLLISDFAIAQQVGVKSVSKSYANSRTYAGSYATPISSNPQNYRTIVGDSVTCIFSAANFEGVSFMYKRQTKEIMKLSFKVDLKVLGSTSTYIFYGLILWKNGARVGFTDTQFDYSTLFYQRFRSPNYTGTGGNGVKTFSKNIDFSKLPSYDSLQVHVCVSYVASKTNPQNYMTFNKNDLKLEPLRTQKGITKFNASTINFNPDLFLLDTFFVAQNTSISLYNDNVAYIPVPEKGKLTFDWSESTIGVQTDSSLRIKAITPGTYNITVKAKDKDGLIKDQRSAVIVVEPQAHIDTLYINPIGNSLTASGWKYQYLTIRDTIDVGVVQNIGTFINTVPSEGRSGWHYATFLSASSPLYHYGKVDYQKYLDTNNLGTPKLIRLSLGINECASKLPNNPKTYSKILIDSLLSQSNAKIIVVLPTSASNTYDGWDANYKGSPTYYTHTDYENYIKCTRSVNKDLYNLYAYGKYNSRVDVAYDTFVIDRNNGYPKTGGVHTNAVHPATNGYKELSKGTSNIINHINQ